MRDDHDLEPVVGTEGAQVVQVLPLCASSPRRECAQGLPVLEVHVRESREAQLMSAKIGLPQRLARREIHEERMRVAHIERFKQARAHERRRVHALERHFQPLDHVQPGLHDLPSS
jgi:hypothetical protein